MNTRPLMSTKSGSVLVSLHFFHFLSLMRNHSVASGNDFLCCRLDFNLSLLDNDIDFVATAAV